MCSRRVRFGRQTALAVCQYKSCMSYFVLSPLTAAAGAVRIADQSREPPQKMVGRLAIRAGEL